MLLAIQLLELLALSHRRPPDTSAKSYVRPLSADALLALQKQQEEQARQRARRRENRAKRDKGGGLHGRDKEFEAISKRLGNGGSGSGGGGGGDEGNGDGSGGGGGRKVPTQPYYYEPEGRQ